MSHSSSTDLPLLDLVEQLPPPAAIRERLGVVLREASLLRRLLKLAEQVLQERARRNRKQGGER